MIDLDEQIDGTDMILIVAFAAIFMMIGITITEFRTDNISREVLNEVCTELYGKGTYYQEQNYGMSHEFVCKPIVPINETINTKPKIRLEE